MVCHAHCAHTQLAVYGPGPGYNTFNECQDLCTGMCSVHSRSAKYKMLQIQFLIIITIVASNSNKLRSWEVFSCVAIMANGKNLIMWQKQVDLTSKILGSHVDSVCLLKIIHLLDLQTMYMYFSLEYWLWDFTNASF